MYSVLHRVSSTVLAMQNPFPHGITLRKMVDIQIQFNAQAFHLGRFISERCLFLMKLRIGF